LPFDPI